MTDHDRKARAVTEAVAYRRSLVNAAIDEELPIQRPERLYEASRYLLEAGGKRLRPSILLLVADALTDVDPRSEDYRRFPDLGGEPVDLMKAAVSVEIIQSFTLIHDDIMDDDDLRRGVPAVHREYDLETAILAGDTLYSKAFEVMLDCNAPPERRLRAMGRLATTCTRICEGQALDVEFEDQNDVTEAEYMEMVELKTAVLFAAAACVPGVLLGADDATCNRLYRYGLDIGRAFQIQDDLLDLTTPSDQLGKQRGSDLVEGKRTLITVHASQHGIDPATLIPASGSIDEPTIERAVNRLESVGSIEFARTRAADLVSSGKAELDVLPANGARDLLADLADYLVERTY